MLETLVRLALRSEQVAQAKLSLVNEYTINGITEVGYRFLFGQVGDDAKTAAWGEIKKRLESDPQGAVTELIEKPIRQRKVPAPPKLTGAPNGFPLESPEQFSISWATLPNVYETGLPSLPAWSSSLTDADAASEQFWPMIAQHGFGYNLIIPEKISGAKVDSVRRQFSSIWSHEHEAAASSGSLYQIDMTRFQAFSAGSVNGSPRFTPATNTLLTQDPSTKALTPIAVTVSGYRGQNRQTFTRSNSTDGAWLYALQAAKTSVTVFGVWIGHVYHWHLVTAAMQMTMFNTFATDHPIYQLLAPQSKFAIPFDDVLLLLWQFIAPPTSMTNFLDFLELENDYAAGRNYFDDDPNVTLKALGLQQSDFTIHTPWDQYPVVQRLLEIWDLVSSYADAFVQGTYSSDSAVANDSSLQTWIATASASDQGNVSGLPKVKSRETLTNVLTSLLYRITAHGISRIDSTANPALTFVANYPQCLQRTDIPRPTTPIDTHELLSYLPNTETIGEAVGFYFIFVFSPPYEQFIPVGGADTELFFPGGTGDPRNKALVELRNGLAAFIKSYQPDAPTRFQWPRNIET